MQRLRSCMYSSVSLKKSKFISNSAMRRHLRRIDQYSKRSSELFTQQLNCADSGLNGSSLTPHSPSNNLRKRSIIRRRELLTLILRGKRRSWSSSSKIIKSTRSSSRRCNKRREMPETCWIFRYLKWERSKTALDVRQLLILFSCSESLFIWKDWKLPRYYFKML